MDKIKLEILLNMKISKKKNKIKKYFCFLQFKITFWNLMNIFQNIELNFYINKSLLILNL